VSVPHESFMRHALELAATAAKQGEVPVGALLVSPNGEIVAEAHNRTRKLSDPTAHAEMLVLREAGILIGDWRLEGHTLYSTLEPCSMCTGAAVLSRIARLVFGARDPKAGMCGSLENLAQDPRLNHHVELIEGVLAGESAYILQRFFQARRS